MFNTYVLKTVLFLLLLSSAVWAGPGGPIPMPAGIIGTLIVNGTQITKENDEGYVFVASKEDGTSYVPAAEDRDGLDTSDHSDYYILYIPTYEKDNQPGGANAGDIAIMHVYKEYLELNVISPPKGRIIVGNEGSVTEINLEAVEKLSGDVDGNTEVDIYDALAVARYDIRLISQADLDLSVADVDGDGTVGIYDALMIAEYVAGLISDLD